MTLHGKVAIVTGGNTGIGKSIVLALAKEGANIVIDYIADPEATEDLEKQVAALGDSAIGVEADVSKVNDLQTLVDAAVKQFGRLDIMVNNAGVETRTSVLDTTEEQYEKVLEINLKSAFFGTQLAAKQMIAQGGGGRIINITSVHEDWPMPGNTPYCLSKGGVRMLTRTAGVELGPHGITVVGVGPGAVATPINTSTMSDPAKMKTLDAAIPLGRMARARRDRQRRRLPRQRRLRATSRPRPCSPTAASCTAAPGCSPMAAGKRERDDVARASAAGSPASPARSGSSKHGRAGDVGRPARLHPVPTAAVPGRHRAGERHRRGATDPAGLPQARRRRRRAWRTSRTSTRRRRP